MIQVLDHGLVRLVDHMGDDLSVVRSARVSYDAEWRTGDDEGKDTKLIHYLMKNKHTSPFESVTFTFEVKAPIFVFRQWHRHRTWSFNEVSARYTELREEFYIPKPEHVGVQSTSNKQMREFTSTDDGYAEAQCLLLAQACSYAYRVYQDQLAAGVPREIARCVLPLSTYSHMFATADLHNLFHFLRLRLHEHAQYEMRVYAEAILKLITPIVPISVQAFEEILRK